MKLRQAAGALALFAALFTFSLTGCTTLPAEPAAGEGQAAAGDDDSSEEDNSSDAKFGQSYTYEDGLRVEVTKVKADEVGEYDAADDADPGDDMIIVTIRIKNGSKEKFDSALMGSNMSYGPDGEPAGDVFASEKGVEGGFEGTISPGRSKSAKFAYVVPKKYWNDVSLEVEADWNHEAVTFQGSVKGLM